MKERKLRRLKDKAIKLIDKGKYDKALEIYKEILAAFPGDATIMIKVGDLCRKLGMGEQAIAVYSNAAHHFAVDGLLLKGIAVCKMILDIDPAHKDTQETLAQLYTRKYGAPPVVRQSDKVATETMGASEKGEQAPVDSKESLQAQGTDVDIPENRPENWEDESSVHGTSLIVDFSDVIELSIDEEEEPDEEIEALDEEIEELNEEIEELDAEKEVSGVGNEFEGASPDYENHETPSLVVELDRPVVAPSELPRIPLFSSLEKKSFIELLERIPLRSFGVGDDIVRQGDPGQSFFVVVSGSVEVTRDGMYLATLEEGTFFGEMAVIQPGSRQATVSAAEPCEVLEIGADELERLRSRYPAVEFSLNKFMEQRLLNNLMLTSPLFTPFSKEDRQSLIEKFEACTFKDKDVVIEQGRDADGLYLVVSGQLRVSSVSADGASVEVAILGPGAIFGEIALLTRQKTTATVTATGRCVLLRMSRGRFGELIMTHPQVLELISRISDDRIDELERVLIPAMASGEDTGAALL